MYFRIIFIVFILFFCVSQMLCAEEQKGVSELADKTEKENEELVENAQELVEEFEKSKESEGPTSFMMPEEMMATLENFRLSAETWNDRIKNHNKSIQYIKSQINVCEANMSHDASSVKHTIRTFLASNGVPIDELVNWRPEGNKVVLIKKD